MTTSRRARRRKTSSADPITAAEYAAVYTPEQVSAWLHRGRRTRDEFIEEQVVAHPRWRLVRIDPKKLETRRSRKWGYVMRGREASNYDGVVAEYASLDPWAAPPGIASRDGSWPLPAFGSPRPTLPRGHFRMIDGNHRADAGKITGVPVLVFVPAEEIDGGNVRDVAMRRRAARNGSRASSRIVRRSVRNHDVVLSMPVVLTEEWDDGTVVTWLASPFPYARKPVVPDKLHGNAVVTRVSLGAITGTQRSVTEHGVRRYLRDSDDEELPLVYRMGDALFIADGHHRLTAALLRGKRDALVRLVDITGFAR